MLQLIHELKARQFELKRQNENLRQATEKETAALEMCAMAFKSAPIAITITTLADGRYVEANSAFARLSGFRQNEVIGRTTKELNIWTDPEEHDRLTNELCEQGKVHDSEINLRDKAGNTKICSYSAELLEINGGLCLISFFSDITARKLVAEQIEILDTRLAARAFELEIANEELETFSYTVSHDLRKPLTTINGYCQLIMELSTCLDPSCLGYIREIYDETLKMNDLIDTLLEFSHLMRSEINREHVDLSGIALAVVSELKLAELERQVAITIVEGVTSCCDANLIRVVLTNLLGNAWKYTGKQDLASIEFGVTETAEGKVYFVRDNGPGFDMAYAEKLFIPFQRLPGATSFKGFGIGLATVQRIIQRHGGRVWAEAEPDKGAVFYFTLQ